MTDADFIVTGAGPAGSTAARFLAAKGHSVLLLDKDDFPRDKACGGGLCPHILEFDYVMETIDEYLESTCTRGMIYSRSMENKIDYTSDSPLFFNIKRKVFDHKLVKFAVERGAELKKAHVTCVKEDSEKATVILKDGSEITAKAVLGAAGPYDPIAKYVREKHGLNPSWGDKEIGTIFVHEFPVDKGFINDVYGEERTALVHLQTAGLLTGDYGYGWVFPKNDVLNIGWGGFRNDIKQINIREIFSGYLDVLRKLDFVPEGLKLTKYKGAPLPLSGNIKKTYYNRLLVLGDAAGFVSPLSGEGIYFAMDSGRIASHIMHRADNKNNFSTNHLSGYQKEWSKKWGKDFGILKMFSKLLMKWPEAILRYGRKDPILRKYLVDIFISSTGAYELKFKIASRVLRDFFLRK